MAGAAATGQVSPNGELSTFVTARTADVVGDLARSAELYAALAAANPDDLMVTRRAISQAIAAGRFDLALQQAERLPPDRLSLDGRLLLVVDRLKKSKGLEALALLDKARSGAAADFLTPFVDAWLAADKGDARALALLDALPRTSPLQSYRDEHAAYIALKLGDAARAEPFARRAIGGAGAREARVRLAMADGFLAAGDQVRANAMLDGQQATLGRPATMLQNGRAIGTRVTTPVQGLVETLLAIVVDLNRSGNDRALPVSLAQVARFADPANSGAALIAANLLYADGRGADALAVLAPIAASDPLDSQLTDLRVRILLGLDRDAEALAVAQQHANGPDAGADDARRLADTLSALDRHADAVAPYRRAIALTEQAGDRAQLWLLYLLLGSSLQSADRWPEARAALTKALEVSPEQPLVLNFLGYGLLERGERLDEAEAMIAKASRLAPEDASITDSLGWAQFKRGRVDEAIQTLQKAAADDPAQAEIHEHLGDALYTAGRRFEARFAWEAAMITADQEMAERVRSKLERGLTAATTAR